MTTNLKIADLRPSHLADLRNLQRSPRYHIQPVRRIMFQRLGLIREGALQENGLRKTWVLTDTGEQLLANLPVVSVPNVPRSPLPPSGYWVDGEKHTVASMKDYHQKGKRVR